jgi:hypothetical protein
MIAACWLFLSNINLSTEEVWAKRNSSKCTFLLLVYEHLILKGRLLYRSALLKEKNL